GVTVAKALLTAGFTGPIISTEGQNADSLLKAVSNPQFLVVREAHTPATTDKLYKNAVAAGVSGDLTANPWFGKDYAGLWAVANGLAKSGDTCTATKFTWSLQSLGKFTIPNNALLGPVDYSTSNSGLTTAQLWVWDASKSASVAKGPTFLIV